VKEYETPFLCYVEDEPMVWSAKFGDRTEAVKSVRNFVFDRMKSDGAGYGAVLDDENGEIICFVEGVGFHAGVPILADVEIPLSSNDSATIVDRIIACF